MLFAATHFQFTDSMRGASSADRSSIMQLNETNLRRNANIYIYIYSSPRLHRSMEGNLQETNTYLIRDKNKEFSLLSSLDPDRLFGLLHALRNSCALQDLFFGLRIPCYMQKYDKFGEIPVPLTRTRVEDAAPQNPLPHF